MPGIMPRLVGVEGAGGRDIARLAAVSASRCQLLPPKPGMCVNMGLVDEERLFPTQPGVRKRYRRRAGRVGPNPRARDGRRGQAEIRPPAQGRPLQKIRLFWWEIPSFHFSPRGSWARLGSI